MTLWVVFSAFSIVVAIVAIVTVAIMGGITIFEPLIKANKASKKLK